MYPPKHHLEHNLEKLYKIIDEFSFATLVSKTEEDVIITHAPLILKQNDDQIGILVGHLDSLNPHAN